LEEERKLKMAVLASERDALRTRLADQQEAVEMLTQQVQSLEFAASSAAGRSDGELIILQADLQAKADMLKSLRKENSDLTAQLHLADSQRATMDAQRAELVKANDELNAALGEKAEVAARTAKKAAEVEAELRGQLESAAKAVRQKSQDLSNEQDQLQRLLGQKSAEYDMAYAELVALRATSSQQKVFTSKLNYYDGLQ